jgi:hypothetical protein
VGQGGNTEGQGHQNQFFYVPKSAVKESIILHVITYFSDQVDLNVFLVCEESLLWLQPGSGEINSNCAT